MDDLVLIATLGGTSCWGAVLGRVRCVAQPTITARRGGATVPATWRVAGLALALATLSGSCSGGGNQLVENSTTTAPLSAEDLAESAFNSEIEVTESHLSNFTAGIMTLAAVMYVYLDCPFGAAFAKLTGV